MCIPLTEQHLLATKQSYRERVQGLVQQQVFFFFITLKPIAE